MNLLTLKHMWKKALYGAILSAMLISAEAVFAVTIENPINANSFPELISSLADALQTIALVLAPVALVIAGFKFITSATAGNQAGLTEARKMFLWILVGTAIVVAASVLAQAMVNFAQEL